MSGDNGFELIWIYWYIKYQHKDRDKEDKTTPKSKEGSQVDPKKISKFK